MDKIKLKKSLKITNDLDDLRNLDFLFIVVPTQYIQMTLKPLKKIIKSLTDHNPKINIKEVNFFSFSTFYQKLLIKIIANINAILLTNV